MPRTETIKQDRMLTQSLSSGKRVTLSLVAWSLFVDALESPPAKNAKLTDALNLHKKSVVR